MSETVSESLERTFRSYMVLFLNHIRSSSLTFSTSPLHSLLVNMPSQTSYTGSRKRTQDDDDASVGTKRVRRIFASPLITLLPQCISFLDLPAEIRNLIYSNATQNDWHLRIDAINPTKLTSTSPISRLNKNSTGIRIRAGRPLNSHRRRRQRFQL